MVKSIVVWLKLFRVKEYIYLCTHSIPILIVIQRYLKMEMDGLNNNKSIPKDIKERLKTLLLPYFQT